MAPRALAGAHLCQSSHALQGCLQVGLAQLVVGSQVSMQLNHLLWSLQQGQRPVGFHWCEKQAESHTCQPSTQMAAAGGRLSVWTLWCRWATAGLVLTDTGQNKPAYGAAGQGGPGEKHI